MKLWRISLFAFCGAAVLTQPHFTSSYYEWMLEHGAYRWDADSIAIPIAGNAFAWLLWGPASLVALFFVFRGRSSPFRLIAWDARKKRKSWLVSGLCVAASVELLREAWEAVDWGNYVEIFYSFWWIAVWLLVRAALLTAKEPNQ